MAKNTMGTKLPRKLEQKMQIVGEQIKLARLRRNLSVAQVAIVLFLARNGWRSTEICFWVMTWIIIPVSNIRNQVKIYSDVSRMPCPTDGAYIAVAPWTDWYFCVHVCEIFKLFSLFIFLFKFIFLYLWWRL